MRENPENPFSELSRDNCFFYAGALRGFSERCPENDRDWIRDASEQFRLLALAYFNPVPDKEKSP